jgi:uncharacterized membrane protein YcaP (DUF421 family)
MSTSLVHVDWGSVFLLDTSPLEIVVRGTMVYLALFLLLRIVPREAGGLSTTDLLVVVLLADAAQNAMAGNYTSVPDGLILVGTIVFWAWALNWLGFRFPRIQRFVHPPPLPLIRDGRMLRRNMAKELITEDELMALLREQGIADISGVALACLEGDGHISVVELEAKHHKAPERSLT